MCPCLLYTSKISRTKNSIKQILIPGMWFENMGITYWGPVDGHNIRQMTHLIKEARKIDHAVLIHVVTKKGKGYAPAEQNPSRFHGVEPFDVATGKPLREKTHPGYTDVFSRTVCHLAKENPRLVAVTAAMPDGKMCIRDRQDAYILKSHIFFLLYVNINGIFI